jgi:hypothetical protein
VTLLPSTAIHTRPTCSQGILFQTFPALARTTELQ